MRRVLLTGFEPFGFIDGNSSWEAVKLAAEHPIEGAVIETVLLPVTFSGAPLSMEAAIEAFDPEVVVAVGQAGGRAAVAVERVAVNLVDASMPDNDGRQPIGDVLVADGPGAYFTGLPLRSCVEAARAAGVPAAESMTAGTYVCNTVFYRLMHLVATRRPGLRGGFVHVPLMPGQSLDGAYPTLSSELAAKAIAAIVRTALDGDPH
ncbi:pyroglutamyl-peptidase I [Glycomyces sp. L485]|uniref:pyroglutamyl-peptidase I n=1 Tax=Glycomyces sp. L485 TaxID=2909235 RepID=UPI001F4B4B49|nr:pyroglutamyl-peptidase I [Glycomyces sp. L485]MCH7229865.1 pyroglutamyl-peptidase I [Glycomyces sp. L485]